MKKITLILSIVLLVALQVRSQEVPALMDEAAGAYKSGNLEDARFKLQQALSGINQAIGRDILEMMPQQLGDMTTIAEEDNVTGMNTGFAGLFVSRHYKGEVNHAEVEIMSDSPFLAGINMLLAMPIFMASDPNQKRIKIDGQKALLTKTPAQEEQLVNYDVQLVFGNTLFTFSVTGIEDENKVTAMLDKIPVRGIMAVAE